MTGPLPERFRDVTERRSEGARVVDAWDGARPVRLLILRLGGALEELRTAVERANRFALGVGGIALAREVVSFGDGCALVYERPAGTLLAELCMHGIPRERAAQIVIGGARALAALHGQGVAHGHVTLETVAVSGDDVQIFGYGLADLAQAVGGPALVRDALPPSVRAPEQQGPSPARHETWTDVFAFGVVAARVLRFDAGGEEDGSRDVAARELVTRLLDASPSTRPADLVAWADALAVALASGPVVSRRAVDEPVVVNEPVVVDEPAGGSPRPEPSNPEPLRPASEPRAELAPRARVGLIAVPIAGVGIVLAAAIGVLFALGLSKSQSRTPTGAPVAVAPDVSAPPHSESQDSGTDVDAGDAGDRREVAATPTADAGAIDGSDPGAKPSGPVAVVPDGGGASEADLRAAIPVPRTAPIWGPAGALVTVVVFGDLECPYTRATYAVLERLKRAFGSELRLVWYDRPIADHPHAESAARWVQALQATRGSAVTWRLLDAALLEGAAPDASALERWTALAGADAGVVGRGAAGVNDVLSAERALAGRYDVRRTPTLFVNGLRIDGALDAVRLGLVVRREYVVGASLVASGVARAEVYSRRVAKNLIRLGPDVPERACITAGSSPTRGAALPLVTIVQFCDYESAGCRRLEPALRSLIRRHPDELRLVWKGLSLDEHPDDAAADRLARAAWSERGDGAFWKVHDRLLAARDLLDTAELGRIAGDLGLDPKRVLDAAAPENAPPGQDAALADRLGVNGVPTCFVNGRPVACSGSGSEFERAVETELGGARSLVARGFERSRLDTVWCGPERIEAH